jgi:hypothetical protein
MIDEMPYGYGTLRTTGVRIRHQVSRRTAQRSQQLENLTIVIVKSRSILNAHLSLQVLSGARENALAQSVNTFISNDPSFRLKHLGVLGGFDGCGRTTYPLTENQTRRIAQVPARVAYLPCSGYNTMSLILAMGRVVYYSRRTGVRLPLLYVRNVETYTHHKNDTYVALFAGVAVMQ